MTNFGRDESETAGPSVTSPQAEALVETDDGPGKWVAFESLDAANAPTYDSDSRLVSCRICSLLNTRTRQRLCSAILFLNAPQSA